MNDVAFVIGKPIKVAPKPDAGAILAGLVFGAIVAFIIDKRFWQAAIFSGAGAILTFVGLIHAEKVQWNAGSSEP